LKEIILLLHNSLSLSLSCLLILNFLEQVAMADWKGIMGKSSTGFGGSSRRDEDFEEEDVWSFMKEREDSTSKMRKPKEYSSGSSSAAWRLPTTPRMIPRVYTPTTHEARVVQQSSAPVDIPDWSKIYGKSAKILDSRHDSWVDDATVSNGVAYDNDDDDNDDGDMVPPHEWIARKLARSQISSFSVCEGIGRTLKGRDLSKVRNAILTKTGFLE
jgi:hypothetical protein